VPLDRAISLHLVGVLGCKRLEQREESGGVQVTAPMHAAGWSGAIGAIQCSFVLPISRSYQRFACFSSCPTFLLTTFHSSRRRHTHSLLNPPLLPSPPSAWRLAVPLTTCHGFKSVLGGEYLQHVQRKNSERLVWKFVEGVPFPAGGDAEVVIFHHAPHTQASHWTLNPTPLSIYKRDKIFPLRT